MARLVKPKIWEGQFPPENKNLIWNKSIPSTGGLVLMRCKEGWEEIEINELEDPAIPFYTVFREPITQTATAQ